MNVVTLPKGTIEYVVMVLGQYPDEFDPAAATAHIAVVATGTDPSASYEAAAWLAGDHGYALLVDTTALALGEYDVWLKVDAGLETPVLGPDRLRVV